jgi:hypothetical protein
MKATQKQYSDLAYFLIETFPSELLMLTECFEHARTILMMLNLWDPALIDESQDPEEDPFCPDDCQYLKPNEADQRRLKQSNPFITQNPHYCWMHKCEVKHEDHHPKLVRVKGCKVKE